MASDYKSIDRAYVAAERLAYRLLKKEVLRDVCVEEAVKWAGSSKGLAAIRKAYESAEKVCEELRRARRVDPKSLNDIVTSRAA